MSLFRPNLTTAAGLLAGVVLAAWATSQPASAQEGRHACEADAFRLCNEFVPDEKKVEACLRRKRLSLSPACRAEMGGGKATKKRRVRRK